MADDGIILGSGLVIRPGEGPYRDPILLEPGQTIFITTKERLNVPKDIVGNTSIKGQLAGQGVLLLTGFIVDPGYNVGGSRDGRLHFRLANLGRRPVLLEPGRTRIASIQFLRLAAETDRSPGRSFDDVWERVDEFQEGLGFIEDLRSLNDRVVSLAADLDRQGRSVSLVVAAGIFIVSTTLLGVIVTGLLTLGAQIGLMTAAERVIPNDNEGRLLGVAALFGFAAIAGSLLTGLRLRHRGDPPDPQSIVYARREALRDLRMERARGLSLATAMSAVVVVAAVAIATETAAPWWGIWGLALILVSVTLAWFWRSFWWAIPRWKVDERVRTWEQEALRRASRKP